MFTAAIQCNNVVSKSMLKMMMMTNKFADAATKNILEFEISRGLELALLIGQVIPKPTHRFQHPFLI